MKIEHVSLHPASRGPVVSIVNSERLIICGFMIVFYSETKLICLIFQIDLISEA